MKPWAYAVIAMVLVGFLGGMYAKGHAAGYNKRDLEVNKEILAALEQQRDELQQHWMKVVLATEAQIVVEEKIVEKIREVEVEIPTVVERIVEVKPECADLGDAYVGLLNNQVRAGNGIQVAAAADPFDEGVRPTD